MEFLAIFEASFLKMECWKDSYMENKSYLAEKLLNLYECINSMAKRILNTKSKCKIIKSELKKDFKSVNVEAHIWII